MGGAPTPAKVADLTSKRSPTSRADPRAEPSTPAPSRVHADQNHTQSTMSSSSERKAAKKARKAAKKAKQSPLDAHFAKLNAVCEATPDCVGRIMVCGVDSDGDSDEESEEMAFDDAEKNAQALTEAQVSRMRWILITEERASRIEAMERALLGEDSEPDENLASRVASLFAVVFEMVKAAPRNSTKFDVLLAFTWAIYEYDTWVGDHALGLGATLYRKIRKLGLVWSEALRVDDAGLGIDSEFTRAGVMKMLKDFKDEVETLRPMDGVVNDEQKPVYEVFTFDYLYGTGLSYDEDA